MSSPHPQAKGTGPLHRAESAADRPRPAALPPRPALLEPPPEVLAAVAKEETRLREANGVAVSPEARKRLLDQWTIDFFLQGLDGVDIAYRPTDQGVELLGVGFEEVRAVRRTYGDGEESDIHYGQL
jgi:hypothetical protein